METDVWFYTFSTSGQVLAALVGLFAVFVVYKLQSISSIFDVSKECVSRLLCSHLSNNNFEKLDGYELKSLFFWDDRKLLGLFRRTLAHIEAVGKTPSMTITTSSPSMDFSINKNTEDFFGGLVERRQGILNDLFVVSVLSLGSIAYCIFCLSFQYLFVSYSKYALLLNLLLMLSNLYLIG